MDNERYSAVPLNRHNRDAIVCARGYADSMRNSPSVLEIKMEQLLNKMRIKYKRQWILFIFSEDMRIEKFYIADFFLPDTNILLEVDEDYHRGRKQQQKDLKRTIDISANYPLLKMVRWTKSDFFSDERITWLKNITAASYVTET